ncbi:MAG TPA: bifunctional demethylmenaquinone methyltransferase/2-methoxy-6-polyprenyl-1,4-benzoquinol methylase UbiE [Planctomycetaceae bacterium]|nr:bifunctional demethylmenaquinone methyltransferase/2-methoxy-6-polyprenyl-1,4-benzoquinol methylase UbiE [Planctomycetaceae bacterium]
MTDASSAPATTSVDKTGSRVQDMFAQIAPRYDLMNHVLSLGIDIRWRKKTLKRLDLSKSLPVLDCCTGTGDLALMLAQQGRGRFNVIGSDFCAPMLDLARKKSKNERYEGCDVEFIEADSQSLPFENETFQAVTCAFGLRNVQNTEAGLREMLRVTAKGGQVGVLEFSKPTLPVLSQVYTGYFKHVLPRVGQTVAKNNQSAYEYLPNSVMQFPSGEEFLELMREIGLQDCQQFPMTLGVATLYLGNKA